MCVSYDLFLFLAPSKTTGTLSADGWSAHSQSFYALLLHYIDQETLEPVSILLGTVKKCKQDAQSLHNETVAILEEWGLDSQLSLPNNERYGFCFAIITLLNL